MDDFLDCTHAISAIALQCEEALLPISTTLFGNLTSALQSAYVQADAWTIPCFCTIQLLALAS